MELNLEKSGITKREEKSLKFMVIEHIIIFYFIFAIPVTISPIVYPEIVKLDMDVIVLIFTIAAFLISFTIFLFRVVFRIDRQFKELIEHMREIRQIK